MEIDRAIIPVAGLGTRLLPTTKAIPKEMLPAGRLPIIHHVVEELIAAGIRRILFVSSRSKVAVENHFDDYSELILHLEADGGEAVDVGRFDYRQRGIEFFFTRQQVPLGKTKPLGTGDAVAASESFVGNAHFVVAFGDSIIHGARGPSLLRRMIASHERHDSSCTIGAWKVPSEVVSNYGILIPEEGEPPGDARIRDVIEKPSPAQTTSRLAVSARYVFSAEVFDQIRAVSPADSGEIYLTEAIRRLIHNGRLVRAVRLGDGEKRYDIGNHLAYFQTFLDFSLADPEYGDEVAAYMSSKLRERGAI
ncbi:MAG: UTP--glucose-1-phosphate uridylyltransferase [Candidatus Latescibacterota bacterium]|nr:UTP--glucose-1-phosphate uridylyltransferase [Candidatus Latescibacterota bacterium]